jgi:hypothetical protein
MEHCKPGVADAEVLKDTVREAVERPETETEESVDAMPQAEGTDVLEDAVWATEDGLERSMTNDDEEPV